MARPDNMTTHTPVDANRWNCTCEQPEGHLVCPQHGKWPNRYTPPSDALEIAAELNAEHDRTDPRVAELAERCRVLTELAQQLTNALDAVRKGYRLCTGHANLTEAALDAAAELGITPQEPQP